MKSRQFPEPRKVTKRLFSGPGIGLGIGLAILALAALPASLKGQSPTPCLTPFGLRVDVFSTRNSNSDANGVLEPGETVGVTPSWSFHHTISISADPCGTGSDNSFGGSFSGQGGLTGPSAGGYVVQDSRADYSRNCQTAGSDCYYVSVSAPTGRPSAHWDASFDESVDAHLCRPYIPHICYDKFATKDWTLHIGDSFTDVPRSQPFYKKIETLLHHGITSGCSRTEFCPSQVISRGQLAVFIAKGLAKSAANIPASGTVGDQSYDCSEGGTSLFTDVSPTDVFCKHIHYIASTNVDSGCAPGLYCPDDNLTRLQMAAFVAKALVQPGGEDAVPLAEDDGLSYSCDPASPASHFTDVPATDPSCRYVNYLWHRGVIAGCSRTEYCPTGEITRDQMAKFLVNAFKLTLYGP